MDQFSVSLARIAAEKWQLEGVHFSFSGILENTQQLNLNIRSLKLSEPLDSIKLVNIHCPKVKVQEDMLECPRGFADIQSDWLDSQKIPFSFYFSDKNSRLNLERIKIAGGTINLVAKLNDGLWQARLQGTNLKAGVIQQRLKLGLFEQIKGKLNMVVNANGKRNDFSSLDAQIDLNQWQVQTKDSRIATEKLNLAAAIQGEKKHNTWQLNSQIDFHNGAIYAEPIYLEASSKPIAITFSGFFQEHNKNFGLENVTFSHPNVLTLSAQVKFDLNKVDDAQVALQVDDLKTTSEVYIQPLLTATTLEGLGFAGKLKANFKLVQQALTDLKVSFSQLAISDSMARIGLQGGTGEINWSKQVAAPAKSKINWQKFTVFSIPFDASELHFSTLDNSLRLGQPAALPIFGGEVVLKKFAMTLKDSQKPDIHFQGAIHNISLEEMTQALNWQPLSGKINGEIPGVSYRENTLSIDGALKVQAFDGEVIVKDLAVSDLLSPLPKFYTDIEINRLDLDQVTSKFDFGNMQGRLSGTVRDLYLENWQPVTFYAWLGTPDDDDSRHRISQKAVNNLASIGGGGAANMLSRTYLRFFENFGYDKVGIGCYLHQGVCQLMGVGAAKQGYYIVKGGGLPRIDVIGYNSRVDWKVLMERLSRITKAKPVN